jgi:hypothetical protein
MKKVLATITVIVLGIGAVAVVTLSSSGTSGENGIVANRIVIADRSSRTAYDSEGIKVVANDDWFRWSNPDKSSRLLCATVLQPNLSDRKYRVRFMDGTTTHGAEISRRMTMRGTEVDILADFPIEKSDAPIKMAIEGTDGKWETIYSGAKGQNTEFATWGTTAYGEPYFEVRNALQPGSGSGRYGFRVSSNLAEGNDNLSISGDGTLTIYDGTLLRKMSWIKIERSEYKSIESRWVAFGKKGQAQDFRDPVSKPEVVAIFSGRPEPSSLKNEMNSFYDRDETGWTVDGLPTSPRCNPRIAWNAGGDELPAWVLVRLPRSMAGVPVHLMTEDGISAVTMSVPIDPGVEGSPTWLYSVRSKYIKPRANFKLRYVSGAPQKVSTLANQRQCKYQQLNPGEFCVDKLDTRSKLIATNVPPQYRNMSTSIKAFDEHGTLIAQGSFISSDTICGAAIYPMYTNAKVAKVELYAQPYQWFELKDIPLVKPKRPATPQLQASRY